jgi:hypothetical protein
MAQKLTAVAPHVLKMNQVLFTELQRLCAFVRFAAHDGASGVEAVAVPAGLEDPIDFGSETADVDASEVSQLAPYTT